MGQARPSASPTRCPLIASRVVVRMGSSYLLRDHGGSAVLSVLFRAILAVSQEPKTRWV